MLGSGAGGLLGGAYLAAASAAPGAARALAAVSLRPRLVLAGAASPAAAITGPAVQPDAAAIVPVAEPAVASVPSDLQCLTEAVYFEARGEPRRGQQAVAQVVMNRVRRPGFPKTVCAVVHQRTEAGCQFSFACEARPSRRDAAAWETARAVAHGALRGEVVSEVRNATHFESVSAVAFTGLAKVARIGEHVFYRFLAPGEARAATLRTSPTASAAAKLVMVNVGVPAAAPTPAALAAAVAPKAGTEAAAQVHSAAAPQTPAKAAVATAAVPTTAPPAVAHPASPAPTAAMSQS